MRILLVEDNPGDARLLLETLKEAANGKFHLDIAVDMAEAYRRLKQTTYDVTLVDLSLPDSHGISTVVAVKSAAPNLAIVVLTGLDDESTAIEAMRVGAQDYLIKGQTMGYLLMRSMRYAIERQRLHKELQEAMATVKQLSGMLPICASCKKIRDDSGYWTQVERYIEERTDASFTHGLCPDCVQRIFPDYTENETPPKPHNDKGTTRHP